MSPCPPLVRAAGARLERLLPSGLRPLASRRAPGQRPLAQALPQCPRLEVVWLDRCDIGDAGGLAIAEVLPRCEALEQLWLRRNKLSRATKAVLREKALPTLRTFRL